ncbi:phosphonopyruvate decarboxylase [bacterium]|nr:phosphonopyruvate decarboxylase [bacterium]
MDIKEFTEIINADFYTGVPDSQLKSLCNYLMHEYGIDKNHHIIAANEGNCVALAAGYHLATGKVPVVYMQNSGEGNIINPVASLLNDNVYAIPTIFIIGWRGEPGVHDEPQHVYQGQITLKLLEDMDIEFFVISKDTTKEQIKAKMSKFDETLRRGKQVAFVVKKGALTYSDKVLYKNDYEMKREEIIEHIAKYSGEDAIISTTGKASRELYEIRERNKQSHKYDFLTVGSMGHSSSIALGIALNKPKKKVWCIDGDGALLMHMGAMALIGSNKPDNLVHIVINNCAHETVGGMPTVANKIDFCKIGEGCGYKHVVCVDNFKSLDNELQRAKTSNELCFIEIKSSIGAREDLGRPKEKPIENKKMFVENLNK